MVLHGVWHVWIGAVGTSGVKLSIAGVCWNTCSWPLTVAHAKITHHVSTSGVSVGDCLHWSLHVLSDCVSKTNGWNSVNIKELEVIGISIAIEVIA